MGRLALISHSDGASTSYKYSPEGLPVERIDQNGSSFKYAWDSQIRLLSRTNPDGSRLEWTYKGSLRKPFSKTAISADGKDKLQYAFSYDHLGRLTKVLYQDGVAEFWKYGCCDPIEYRNRSGVVTRFSYDAMGRKIQELFKGEKTIFTYDFRDRVVKTVFPDKSVEETSYNDINKIAAKTFKDKKSVTYEYDCMGQKTKETWSDGSFSEYKYSTDGKILSVSGTHGQNVEYAYNGNGHMASMTTRKNDAAANTTSFEYDPHGRMIKSVQDNHVATYLYDDKTGRTNCTIENGVATVYINDSANKTVAVSAVPEQEFLSAKNKEEKDALIARYVKKRMAYDADGRLLESRDAAGRLYERRMYRYDGRLESDLLTQGPSKAVLTSYFYGLDKADVRTERQILSSVEQAARDWKL